MGGDCHLFDKAFSSNDSIVHSRRGRGKTNENRRRHLEAPSRMGNIDYNIWETVRPPPILTVRVCHSMIMKFHCTYTFVLVLWGSERLLHYHAP